MAWMPSTEVRNKLNELDQTELEVRLTEKLLLLPALRAFAPHKLCQVGKLVFPVNFLVTPSHRLQESNKHF